jgi:hypothetical protein
MACNTLVVAGVAYEVHCRSLGIHVLQAELGEDAQRDGHVWWPIGGN